MRARASTSAALLPSLVRKVRYGVMAFTQEQIKNALKSVKYPGFSRDIVSFGLIKEIVLTGDQVRVQMVLTTNDPAVPRTIKAEAENVLRGLGVPEPKVLIDIHAPPAGAGSSGVGATRIPGIKHIIAIASGKGGVGKSTVAANLAVAFQNSGARVGLCDCDIYGPSISLMFGSREQPMATEENRILPIDPQRYDIFSSGGGEREAKRLRVPLLGQIPIDIATREAGDRGMPIAAEDPNSAVGAEFSRIARELLMKLN